MKKSILALTAFLALAPAAALAQPMPVRVGDNVKAPERIRYVPPVYPEIAMSARVSGIIVLEAVVAANGSVTDVQVLKSVPLLDQAAIDAVKEWAYAPTTLNGVPVPIIMTVTVNFSLDTPASAPPEWNGVPATRVGGEIKAPERIKYVPPAYPEEAQAAKVSGVVIIEALIDEAGNVATAKVLKGIPLLDQAALDAVMQWKYTPILLNGAAVPVVMTVTVNFSIGGR